jgi:hypothetical protein
MKNQPISRTFKVGKRLTCTMTYEGGHLTAVWDPRFPPEGLTEAEKADYRAGRNALTQKVAAKLGIKGSVLVVEA